MQPQDQLLDMLTTIEEAEVFLRKRCAGGMAGQSIPLFEDLFSLIELIQNRFRKTEYLPMRSPVFRNQTDAVSAVALLDQVQKWTSEVREQVRRKELRQQLARGGILDAAANEGKPFAQTAKALVEIARNNAVRAAQVPKAETPAAPFAGVSAPEISPPVQPPAAAAPRFDASQESAKLMRAIGQAGKAKSDARAAQTAVSSAQAEPVKPAARPMGAEETPAQAEPTKPAARPMGAEETPAQAEPAKPAARPMGAEETPAPAEPAKPAARPMGAEETPAQAEPARPAARPMGAEETPAQAEPTKPAARPMGAAEPSAQAEPAKPASQQMQVVGGGANEVDRAFKKLMDELEPLNEKQVAGRMIGGFPKIENRYKMVMIDYLRRFPYWGPLDPDKDVYGVFSGRAAQLVQHRRDLLWLYDRLGDYRSKKTLWAILDNWYSFNFKDLTNMKERMFANYLDLDLLQIGNREVLADLGAYTGEVTRSFIDCCGGYQKIYCYEIADGNFASLRENVGGLANVELRQKGVCDHAGTAFVAPFGDASTNRLTDQGAQQVQTVTLDEDLQGEVTLIKMNLEGGEQAALQGCGEHIHRSRPKLVIRLDHQTEDLWKIPRMVDRLEPKYRLYLRHYGGNLVPAEYVLFAV